MQHLRAGEVKVGRRREIADYKANFGSILGAKAFQDGFKDRIGIDINQRRLRTEGDDAAEWFIFRVAVKIGISVRSGNAAEKGYMGP